MSSTPRIFNVKPSPRDTRDFVYTSTLKLDRSIDLRANDSPVEDQGALGSCVAHAVTSAYENQLLYKYPERFTELSRLFLYYHTRLLENNISADSGVVYLRSSMRAGNKYGICAESLWDYMISEFASQPSPDSYVDAADRKIVDYQFTRNMSDIIDALNQSKPVVVGFEVYQGFMAIDEKKPTIPIPAVTETSIGGHAVCLVGYSASDQHFIFKNSFGTDWGINGYGYMSLEYTRLYAFDRWTFDITDPDAVC